MPITLLITPDEIRDTCLKAYWLIIILVNFEGSVLNRRSVEETLDNFFEKDFVGGCHAYRYASSREY